MNIEELCMGCMEEKGGGYLCQHCGFDESNSQYGQALKFRTKLKDQYIVGKVLGQPGGFGITYLAWDSTLHTKVAVKEYFPRSCAGRASNGLTLIPNSGDEKSYFGDGLERFLTEARTLAKFKHRNVVGVKYFFEDNGTGYLVMDYYEGCNLEEHVQRNGGKLSEKNTLTIMFAVMEGLKAVHGKDFLHLDIKPPNIYLANWELPVLLDFGAARVVVATNSQTLSSVLTPGFAPFEQYSGRGEKGPWTDIYAAGATLYYMVTGVVPIEAVKRVDQDPLLPPDKYTPGLSKGFVNAVCKALSVHPRERPQSISEFQNLLFEEDNYAPEFIRCPSCLSLNSVNTEFIQKARCGKCNQPLLTEKGQDYDCEKCSSKNLLPIGSLFHQLRCGSCRELLYN